MRTALLALTTVAAAALVAGCLETKQDVTVNPDGSGKTRVEIVMSDMPFSMTPQQDPPDPQVNGPRTTGTASPARPTSGTSRP